MVVIMRAAAVPCVRRRRRAAAHPLGLLDLVPERAQQHRANGGAQAAAHQHHTPRDRAGHCEGGAERDGASLLAGLVDQRHHCSGRTRCWR